MSVALDERGARLAILDQANTISLFDVGNQERRSNFEVPSHGGLLPDGSAEVPLALEFLDQQRLFVACRSTGPGVYSVAGELVIDLALAPPAPIMAVATDRKRGRVAIGDALGRIAVRSLDRGDILAGPIEIRPCNYLLGRPHEILQGKGLPVRGGVYALAWSPDGRYLAIGPGQAKLLVWDFENSSQALSLLEFSYADQDLFGDLSIGGVAFGPDSKIVYSIAFDHYLLRAWRVDRPGQPPLWENAQSGNARPVRPSVSREGSRIVHPLRGHVVDASNGSVLAVLAKQLQLKNHYVCEANDELVWLNCRDRLHVFDLANLQNHMEIPLND